MNPNKSTFTKSYASLLLLLSFGLLSLSPNPPSVFLIGDSISIQYGPYLEKYTQGMIEFDRKRDDGNADESANVIKGANGGDSKMVLAYLKAKLKEPDFKPDYLLLNCGLHDIKRQMPEGKLQVEAEDYRKNLTEIVGLAGSNNIRLIWIRTTAVVDTIHNSHSKAVHRYAEDLAVYNQIADEVTQEFNVPVIDLHGFTWKLGIEHFMDHVHYDDSARALQAAFITGNLNRILFNTAGQSK